MCKFTLHAFHNEHACLQSVSPSIITSRHSARIEFGYYIYIMWARTYIRVRSLAGGGMGQGGANQPAVNHVYYRHIVNCTSSFHGSKVQSKDQRFFEAIWLVEKVRRAS